MENDETKEFFELIKKNADISKLKIKFDNIKKQGNNDFLDKYYSEKRTPLICKIILIKRGNHK